MTLQDVLEQLHHGELSQLARGELLLENSAEGRKNRQKIINSINLGLTEIYKRFWLKTGELLLQINNNIFDYEITSKYAVTNYLNPVSNKYIIDSQYCPYTDDLLKIERLFDPEGEEQYLNDDMRPTESFFTPKYNILRVPVLYKHQNVLIEYRANHPKIEVEDIEEDEKVCETELELPWQFLEPLLLFVAHREFRILNTDQKQEAMAYYQQFEAQCALLENQGLEITPNRTLEKLDVNGWV